jgi:hypothetical protein
VKNLVADRKSKEDNEITVVNLVGIWVWIDGAIIGVTKNGQFQLWYWHPPKLFECKQSAEVEEEPMVKW